MNADLPETAFSDAEILDLGRAADGHLEVKVERSAALQIFRIARSDPRLECGFLVDLCAVDRPGVDPRFEVVYHLASLSRGHRLRVRVPISEDDPTLPSATGVWKAADWFEREAWDLYGIRFEGHPGLKRILTHEAFAGHPLRKDFPVDGRRLPAHSDGRSSDDLGADRGGNGRYETRILDLERSFPLGQGTLRTALELEGEAIRNAECEIGLVHRCFEKLAEGTKWNQLFPLTERLNHNSATLNSVGYALAVESLTGIDAPPRAQVLRVILSESARITDHALCLGSVAAVLGATRGFRDFFEIREEVCGLFEAWSGARVMPGLVRVGGLLADVPPDFGERLLVFVKRVTRILRRADRLIASPFFRSRTVGVGAIDGGEALEWGWTGPCLRACGIAYDVRKDSPYLGYDGFEFDLPIASGGDCHARFLVRMEEIRQSLRILEQAAAVLPEGPVMIDDPHIAPPARERISGEIGSLIRHCKLVTEGFHVPEGEAYHRTEGANGELGFFIISNGGTEPYRIKVRPPSFAHCRTFAELLPGHALADAAPILASLNVIAGEMDR